MILRPMISSRRTSGEQNVCGPQSRERQYFGRAKYVAFDNLFARDVKMSAAGMLHQFEAVTAIHDFGVGALKFIERGRNQSCHQHCAKRLREDLAAAMRC